MSSSSEFSVETVSSRELLPCALRIFSTKAYGLSVLDPSFFVDFSLTLRQKTSPSWINIYPAGFLIGPVSNGVAIIISKLSESI